MKAAIGKYVLAAAIKTVLDMPFTHPSTETFNLLKVLPSLSLARSRRPKGKFWSGMSWAYHFSNLSHLTGGRKV